MGQSVTIAERLRDISADLQTSPVFDGWLPDERSHQARREAETLVCHVTGWNRLSLLQHLAEPMPNPADAALQSLAERRQAGEPLAYILGYTDFYGRTFQTRPGGLIPRPDTESLVERAIAWIRNAGPQVIVVDLGTGTGCIAITVALECSQARVIALDVSPDAAAIARDNAGRLGADVDVRVTDGMQFLADCTIPPNVIVSNPPYIPTGEIEHLDVSVRLHEPALALDGGSDGLAFYRQLVSLTPAVFADGPAAMFLEVGMGQAAAVCEMFQADERWSSFSVCHHADVRGVSRIVAVVRE